MWRSSEDISIMCSSIVLLAKLHLVSPIYYMTVTPDFVFKKEVKLSLDHLAGLGEDTKPLFVFAHSTLKILEIKKAKQGVCILLGTSTLEPLQDY